MGLTDYSNKEIEYTDNGSKIVTTHEKGSGYDDGYHTRVIYDKNGELVKGSVYNGRLYGEKTHDDHSHYDKDGGCNRGVSRSSIFDD